MAVAGCLCADDVSAAVVDGRGPAHEQRACEAAGIGLTLGTGALAGLGIRAGMAVPAGSCSL